MLPCIYIAIRKYARLSNLKKKFPEIKNQGYSKLGVCWESSLCLQNGDLPLHFLEGKETMSSYGTRNKMEREGMNSSWSPFMQVETHSPPKRHTS